MKMVRSQVNVLCSGGYECGMASGAVVKPIAGRKNFINQRELRNRFFVLLDFESFTKSSGSSSKL